MLGLLADGQLEQFATFFQKILSYSKILESERSVESFLLLTETLINAGLSVPQVGSMIKHYYL